MRNKDWIEFNNHINQNKNIDEVDGEISFAKSRDLKIHKEKKGKKGKIITIISGFSSENSIQLARLLKNLKVFCGTGGSLNDQGIQLQGDLENKVKDFLRKDGYEI